MISVLSWASRKKEKHNAAGVSTGEDRGEQHTGADKTIKVTPVPLCGELMGALNSLLASQLFLTCDGFMSLQCLQLSLLAVLEEGSFSTQSQLTASVLP